MLAGIENLARNRQVALGDGPLNIGGAISRGVTSGSTGTGIGTLVYSGSTFYYQADFEYNGAYTDLGYFESSSQLYRSLQDNGIVNPKVSTGGIFHMYVALNGEVGQSINKNDLQDLLETILQSAGYGVSNGNLDITYQPAQPVNQDTNPSTQQQSDNARLQSLGLDPSIWQINKNTGEPEKKPKSFGDSIKDFFSELGTVGSVAVIVGGIVAVKAIQDR